MYGLHKIAETLQESGCVLEGVPGFYRDTEERWTLNFKTKNSGSWFLWSPWTGRSRRVRSVWITPGITTNISGFPVRAIQMGYLPGARSM